MGTIQGESFYPSPEWWIMSDRAAHYYIRQAAPSRSLNAHRAEGRDHLREWMGSDMAAGTSGQAAVMADTRTRGRAAGGAGSLGGVQPLEWYGPLRFGLSLGALLALLLFYVILGR